MKHNRWEHRYITIEPTAFIDVHKQIENNHYARGAPLEQQDTRPENDGDAILWLCRVVYEENNYGLSFYVHF